MNWELSSLGRKNIKGRLERISNWTGNYLSNKLKENNISTEVVTDVFFVDEGYDANLEPDSHLGVSKHAHNDKTGWKYIVAMHITLNNWLQVPGLLNKIISDLNIETYFTNNYTLQDRAQLVHWACPVFRDVCIDANKNYSQDLEFYFQFILVDQAEVTLI